MALPPRFQGLDAFWQLTKPQFRDRNEAALALTHWLLVGSGYRCVGHETELSRDPTKTPSELLPADWYERSAGFYSLLYTAISQCAADLILLKFTPETGITDGVILGQILVSGSDDDVIPFEVNSFHIIPEQWQTQASPSSFPHFKAFVDTVDRDLVEKLRSKKRGEGTGVGAARPPPPAGSEEQPPRYTGPPVPAALVPAVPNPFGPLAPPPLAEFLHPRSPEASSSAGLQPRGKKRPASPKKADGKKFLWEVYHFRMRRDEVPVIMWDSIQAQKVDPADRTMNCGQILELVLGQPALLSFPGMQFQSAVYENGVEELKFKVPAAQGGQFKTMVDGIDELPFGIRRVTMARGILMEPIVDVEN